MARTTTGCSKRLSSKAAASEEARRTGWYVARLREARTPLTDFFSILLLVLSTTDASGDILPEAISRNGDQENIQTIREVQETGGLPGG